MPRIQNLQIIGAFIGARVGQMPMAEAADARLEILVFVSLESGLGFAHHLREAFDAVL